MNQHYDRPNVAARAVNSVIRRLAEMGISIAGSRALRVRGRTSGALHSVVVNVMRVEGTDYLVSPRGNTQWARNARAAGAVELGPRWRHAPVALTEVADDDKPALLKRYLDTWYWEVKGHIAGLTPASSADQLRAAAPAIPVFALAP
ncbi:nitroreductase/quinone reductase family protein [Mycolicibacterium sarraceniae]|nr:nitroreductase/quinone reductase family protein [Mycolicibacterium sarraceniae]